MKHRDLTLIRKISAEIEIAMEILGRQSAEDFERDEIKKRAVCMTVINVGELVKNLSDEIRQKYHKPPAFVTLPRLSTSRCAWPTSGSLSSAIFPRCSFSCKRS